MLYFEEADLSIIFDVIREHYTSQENIPHYFSEKEGVKKLLGAFEQVKTNLYPNLVDKVVYLFVHINKGHFFSNGNKRLALVVALGFLAINNTRITPLSRKRFREILVSLFPQSEEILENQKDFSPEEYALYNLSIIVADSATYIQEENEFDALKLKVSHFFDAVTVVQ